MWFKKWWRTLVWKLCAQQIKHAFFWGFKVSWELWMMHRAYGRSCDEWMAREHCEAQWNAWYKTYWKRWNKGGGDLR